MIKLFSFTFMLNLIGFLSFSQPAIRSFKLVNTKICEYEKAEWNINISIPFSNPFDQKEISVDMALTSPSGNLIVLPCYFESGDQEASTWKARFAPRERGKYSYKFHVTKENKTEESVPGSFISQPGSKPGFLHKNDLYTFRFDNGDLFRGIGENVAWESREFESDKWTYDYILPTLSNNGANFFRTWMCPWNLPLEWKNSGNLKRYANTNEYFNPGGIKRMDELVNLTDSLGLYFMLTLDMNKGDWNKSPYNLINGGPVKTWPEFFSSPVAIQKYKDKLRYLVARWGYSTNICAWEFFNEIDNGVFGKEDTILIPLSAVTQWHNEMGRYLKDIDPYQHLVTTSISHRDIAGLNSIAYIDFNQKHIYKHTEKIPAIYADYIQTYGKPYVIGEFGYRWEDQDTKYAKEADFDYKRGLWYGLFSPTPILPMSWWWELFDNQNMTSYFKGVREISDLMLKTGQGSFAPFPVTADIIHTQGMKCGNKYFVYLLNNSDSAVTTKVSFSIGSGTHMLVQLYTPGNRQYSSDSDFLLTAKRFTLNNIKVDSKKELILMVTADAKN